MQIKILLPLLVILSNLTPCLAQPVGDEETLTLTRSHRILSGLKAKFTDDFSAQTFGAVYLGDGPQYKIASATDPYAYNGWDLVPGFSLELGEIFNGIKLSTGGDLYLLNRVFQKGAEELFEYRPRWNVVLTKPLAIGGSVQWTSRFERSSQLWYQFPERPDGSGGTTQVKETTQQKAMYRYRSALKISGPQYTGIKLSPYIYSESFNQREAGEYYSETELGVSFSPIQGLGISLADNFQMKFRPDEIIKNHMLCIYAFYTMDLTGLSLFRD